MKRTRVKICGLTRAVDVEAAVEAGADAVGFVCYPASPRYVEVRALRALAAQLPSFVTPVLLFVNAAPSQVSECVAQVPHALLQLQGDEIPAQCNAFGRAYVKAIRMLPQVDLLDCEQRFADAAALLVDAPAPGYGGGGQVFDWTRLPASASRRKPLILAGGLQAGNVAAAMRAAAPYAVDVSSGVETSRGVKSVAMMQQFIAAVRMADDETITG